MSASLVSELQRLADALESDSAAASQFSLPSVAARLAENLCVQPDEVAIFGVSTRGRHLYFLFPEELKNLGNIPLSSASSFAARTARERRARIVNKFASTRHSTVSECAPLAGRAAAGAIQKIVSAPILSGEKVIGVVQISRRGRNATQAGPDFTPEDLGKVLAVCGPLGKLLQRLVGE